MSWFLRKPSSGLTAGLLLSVSSHGRERASFGVSSSSYKNVNPTMGSPPSCPHLNLITSQRTHLLIPSPWGLGTQHMHVSGGEGNKHSVHNSIPSYRYVITYLAIFFSFLFFTSLLEYNCFTMLCQFPLYNKVNQLYVYIYPHMSSLFCLPPTLRISALQVVTKHRADLPVLCTASHQLSILHLVVYICPCHSLTSSH